MIAESLRSGAAVRERCRNILEAVLAGESGHFVVSMNALESAADHVARVTRERYPDGSIPYHGRWRHFEAGGIDRLAELENALTARFGSPSAVERARAQIDLTVISVLLDAGAGPDWSYHESRTDRGFARSEGLAVASFRAFMAGAFSSRPDEPQRVDGQALQHIDANRLAHVFQAHADNPIVGLEARAALLNRLGEALLRDAPRFGPEGRPGELFFRITDKARRTELAADALLHALISGFGGIWQSASAPEGLNGGDVWPHRFAGGSGPTAGWVPFHKLLQWLTYSLLEPFEQAGVQMHGLDDLTALPEYRNGGLLIDTGVIVPRDPALAAMPLTPADEAVIEWRALTVALIDELAPRVRERLGTSAREMPLARILEGGTWAAGRALANERRDGRPPLNIITDGTFF
ncbi:MAG: URC4/urg3 family protein [Burkholderiaceae bacterium]